MRLLWQRYGRDFYRGAPKGLDESEVTSLFYEATGADVQKLLAHGVYDTRDLPLPSLLREFGITLKPEYASRVSSLGARLQGHQRAGSDCILATVFENGAAQRAGLSAGDVLVAVDGLRVTANTLDSLLARYQPGAQVEIHAFHCDVLRCVTLTLDEPLIDHYRLLESTVSGTARAWRNAWLRVDRLLKG
jgi:predicted metalloprotease with PDZ domain